MSETIATSRFINANRALTPEEEKISGHLSVIGEPDKSPVNVSELKIVKVKSFDLDTNRKAYVIFVPYPQLREYQAVHTHLIRQLEKKMTGVHVLIVGHRNIERRPMPKRRNAKQKRPRNRTLTSVHDAYLADICYPADIVGRRIRVKSDKKRLMKIHLDIGERTNVEHKLDTFQNVYKNLTGKDVEFEFPEVYLENKKSG
ncbi:hypothetical protein SNEBB_000887 [Seison nebaliae]|nr:hypothetical protein SNEBB_000887 [Seison nebaliae]